MVMHVGLALVLWVAAAGPQERQDEPPPKPVVEVPPLIPPEPVPRFPGGDGFTLRTIALRPRFQLTTREFDVGMLSGKMNFGQVADFDRTALAWDGRVDAGAWTFSATVLHQESESRLDFDTVFEQHLFPAGSRAKSAAFFGTLEIFRRFDVAGGRAESYHVSLLAGLNLSKMYLLMRAGDVEASEGFSALWPLPAIGVEARVSLTERLSLTALARGTRFRYDNPFQLDGGGSQDIRYLYGRLDVGLEWSLSQRFTIAAGYTGIDAYINAASAEDTDSADLKAGGIFGGVLLQF